MALPRYGLARRRRSVGLSQEALAEQLGVDRSTVGRWETGKTEPLPWLRPLVASALGVSDDELDKLLAEDPSDLESARNEDRTEGALAYWIADLAKHLASYRHLLSNEAPRLTPSSVATTAAAAHRTYQAGNYVSTAAMLPGLLAATDAFDLHQETHSRLAHVVRCSVYTVAARLLRKVGEGHLAWLAADRAAHAALTVESVSAQGMAAYEVVCALLRTGQGDEAERIAVVSAERLTAKAASDAPDVVSLAGALWLIGGVIAARRTDRSEAHARLDRAQEMADLLGHDGNFSWTAFGPTNVLIHRGTIASELGDPHRVLEAAALVDVEALPVGLNGRRARIHLDLAWAQTQARNDMEAVLHLQQAERVAPESLRHNTIAREQLRELLRRARRPSPALTGLANRAGVLE